MLHDPALRWEPTLARRLRVARWICSFWVLAIVARLLFLQVAAHDDLNGLAARQQSRTIEAPAKRGDIFDRRGRLLAYSVDADTIYAVPSDIQNVDQSTAALCQALGCTRQGRQDLHERLSKGKAFVYVARRVSPAKAKQVAALNLPGIGFVKESRRFYPNRELAAHVLGYVGLDNVGLHGVEAAYDKTMLGRAGTVLVHTDARRRAFSRVERVPTTGSSIELTIDEPLQYIVERELAEAVESQRADAGSAIVMDPRTGEILAMASVPTFNPNDFNRAPVDARRNRSVQDLYEPGSTFKSVTASAGIEEKVFSASDLIDVSGGRIRFGSRVISEYGGHNYRVLSFKDVIVKSSNVGAVRVGLKLGAERLGMYINRFGFGKRTSRDFPGENPGIVWEPSRLNDSALASISMGYQVGVTPLQMVAAISAIANGGHLFEPRLIRAVTRDGVRTEVTPRMVRRAIESSTAAEVTGIMEAVVNDGTAKAARIQGFTVAGKTGTAEKLIDGRYSATANHASFVGFVPSRDPVFAIIVVIDTPRTGSRTGGVAAAPVFKRIAEAALRHAGVPATLAPLPPVLVADADVQSTAPELALAPTLTPALAPMGRAVPDQLAAHAAVIAEESADLVPDLRGLGARDALRILARFGLEARMTGNGVVVAQSPEPGTPLERGAVCALTLHRDPSRVGAGMVGSHP